ncbi:MAG: riboflavin biosynthesis protein RibF [Prevotella sp.]|nr:riboflavin biosynthesis protein RibF [Prevotella sp.]
MEEFAATIGMFDGVHRGHQFVLRRVMEVARERGLQSMAVTFRPAGDRMPVKPTLTPTDEKLRLIAKAGIERTEVLPFTDELRQMTARDFMQQVLLQKLHVRVLLIGYDNRFGHRPARTEDGHEEGFADYVRYGKELGIEVLQLPAEGRVSSSHIRQLLQQGMVAAAADSLGYHYTVAGRIGHGEHVGTRLGFPTANLEPADSTQLLPAPGVYAVMVRLEGSAELKQGMMNIGHRPTFDGHRQTLEVNIFRLEEDLYGQQMEVVFVERLRDERRFADIAALKAQLQHDKEQTEQLLNKIAVTK